ncbi:MAG: hypothetical protein H6596_00770 [Flavobacteriales bacterium]|nr:hypothetical protein [Flavobacteriales bacterium]
MVHSSIRSIAIALAATVLIIFNAAGQCGTEVTPSTAQHVLANPMPQGYLRGQQQVVSLPIKAHIIRQTDGTGGLTSSELNLAMADLNAAYQGSGFQFFLCGPINFIDNDLLYDLDLSFEALLGGFEEANVINVFFPNIVTSNGNSICGKANFPPQSNCNCDRVIVQGSSCALNGSTFAHEVGHYLFLFHTHEDFFGEELVNGSNCPSTGDLLCDTPADPTLSNGNVNTACVYTGNATDSNGDTYSPDTDNFMSYSRKECRTAFTSDQLDRMDWAYQTYRSYLQCNQAPENDDCFDARELVSSTVCAYEVGNVELATTSGMGVPWCDDSQTHPLCGIFPDMHDVFFKFTAVTNEHTIEIDPIGNLDAVVSVYGSCASGANELICEDDLTGQGGFTSVTYSNFVPGNEYYIRVYDWCSSANVVDGSFNICVTHQGGSVDPCSNVITINGCGAGNTQTYIGGGTGSWFNSTANDCGYDTPGEEQVYEFTPSVTGVYSIQVNIAAGGFVDYLWKSGSCGSSSWDCIADINSPGQYGSMSWTAGQTYYILLDDEVNPASTQTFYINCPAISLPDLVVSNVSLNYSEVCPGQALAITHTITNTGSPGTVNEITQTGFWLVPVDDGCPTSIPPPSGTYIDDTNLFPFDMSDDIEVVETLQPMPVFPEEDYLIAVVVDHDTDLDELEEEVNNISCAQLTISSSAEPPPAEISGSTELCPGGTTLLSISNYDGTFLDYLWSTGATGSSITVSVAGTYSVTVTGDGNCSSSVVTQVVVTELTADGDSDGIPDCADDCPSTFGTVGSACDDGDILTVGETLDASCNCGGGTPVDCEGTTNGAALPGTACDDGDILTVGETWDASCNCSGGTLVDCEGTTNGAALPGTACDDGDILTVGETWDASCNCSGGTLVDCEGPPMALPCLERPVMMATS